MEAKKVRLTKEKETYLATLYGKALDAAAPHPILDDHFAAEAVGRIDFDFRELKLPKGAEVTLPIRARHFDQWTREFLAKYPEATVLHLGAGLDTRVYRIDPGPAVRWFDVDLPDVIALREQLYPAREGYQRIGASVTDLGWLDAVPGDRPVMVVAEGLMMYLREGDGIALIRRITEQFPSGQIAFDAYSATMVRMTSRLTVGDAKVNLVWGIDDPREIERKIPKLHLVDDVAFLTMREVVEGLSKNRFQLAVHKLFGRVPFYRRLVRHLRYAFSRDPAKTSAS